MKKSIFLLILLVFCTSLFACSNYEINITYQASEGGYIDGNPSQSYISKNEEEHTFESVSAVANEGYHFVDWSDGLTEIARVDTLKESAVFVAIFEKIPTISVEYIASEGGIIVGKPNQKITTLDPSVTFECVVAKPNKGYRFIGWNDGLKEESRTDTLSKSKVFMANFEKDPTVAVSYIASEGGFIVGDSKQTSEGPFTSKTVVAVVKDGYRFVGWDDGLTSMERSDDITASTTLVAIFIKVHTLSFSCNTMCGSISGQLTQKLDNGTYSLPVTATADLGYRFSHWSNGETNSTITINARESQDIEAIFEIDNLSLPVISIITDYYAPITSTKNYLPCAVSLENTKKDYVFTNIGASIRGRGNTTWDYDKKPYRLKFSQGVDLFGNGKAKDWVLLTNHSDLSLSRNFLAQNVASLFDSINCASSVQFVELYLNYEYLGVYLICEQIEVQENRIDISKDLQDVDTGYLLEIDGRAGGYYFVFEGKNYVIKSPDTDSDKFTDEHVVFITDYLNKCMESLDGESYSLACELIDVESFADAYIVYELFKSADIGFASFYMYKDAGGKLYAGPVWDFDRSLGIVGNTKGAKEYDTLWAKEENPWFKALFIYPEFEILVKERLEYYAPLIEERLDNCYEYLYANRDSFDRNFVRWDILGTFVWPNDDELTALYTWDMQIEYTRDYLKKSLAYMKEVIRE